jgi:hypothetical protein
VPRWRPDGPADVAVLDPRPLPLDLGLLRRSPGSAASWPVTAVVAAVALVAGLLLVNPLVAAVLAVAAVLGLRVERARPLLALGPATLLAAAGAFILLQQLRHGFRPGFRWPEHFEEVHPVAFAGVLLLALEVAVDRLRRPR